MIFLPDVILKKIIGSVDREKEKTKLKVVCKQWQRLCEEIPSNLIVVTASEDHSLKVWDVTAAELLFTSLGHKTTDSGCKCSEQGTSWSPKVVNETCRLPGHSAPLWNCQFSPNGKFMLSAASDHTLKVTDANVGSGKCILRGSSSLVKQLQGLINEFGPEDVIEDCERYPKPLRETFIIENEGRLVTIRNRKNGIIVGKFTRKTVHTLRGHTGVVLGCCWLPAQKNSVLSESYQVVSASSDRTVKVWTLRKDGGQVRIHTLKGHTDSVRTVAASPDGTALASGGYDRTVRIWKRKRDFQPVREQREDSPVIEAELRDTAPAHDVEEEVAELVGEQTRDATIEVERIGEVEGSGRYVAHGADGARSTGSFYNPENHEIGHAQEVLRIDMSQERVPQSNDQTQNLGPELSKLEIRSSQQDAGECSHTGRGGESRGDKDRGGRHDEREDKEAEEEEWCMAHTLTGHAGWVWCCSFSPDSLYVASASEDCLIKVWSADEGRFLFSLRGHGHYVRSVQWSQDGLWMVSGSDDRSVKVWNVGVAWESKARCAQLGLGVEELELAIQHTSTIFSSGRFARWKDAGYLEVNGVELELLYEVKDTGKVACIYDTQTGIQIWRDPCERTLQGFPDCVHSCAFSTDGRFLVAASYDPYMVSTWFLPEKITKDCKMFTCRSVFSQCTSGSKNAVRGSSIIRVWNTETWNMESEMTGDSGRVFSLHVKPDFHTYKT